MRIAIVGAHGVGKTTLSKEISKILNLSIVPDTAAEAFHKGWQVNEKTTIENQLWIMCKQIEYERELKDNYIADKALYDNFVYAKVIFQHDSLIKVIEEVVLKNSQYDLIFYLPIEFNIEADGRSTDKEFQKFIDDTYLNFLSNNNLYYFIIKGNIKDRIDGMLEHIKNFHDELINDEKNLTFYFNF